MILHYGIYGIYGILNLHLLIMCLKCKYDDRHVLLINTRNILILPITVKNYENVVFPFRMSFMIWLLPM